MIVCVCSNLNETKVRKLIKYNKIKSIRDFHKLQICSNCAKCYPDINKLIKENE